MTLTPKKINGMGSGNKIPIGAVDTEIKKENIDMAIKRILLFISSPLGSL